MAQPLIWGHLRPLFGKGVMLQVLKRAPVWWLPVFIAALFVFLATTHLSAAEFYNDWATNRLSSVPSQSGPTNDPDSDGVANLAEFALGTNPLVSDGIGDAIFALPPETNRAFQVEILERAPFP